MTLTGRYFSDDADNPLRNFQVYLGGAAGDSVATLTDTVNFSEGSGTYLQVLDLENRSHGNTSNYYRETPQPLIPDTFASSSLVYDMYTVLVKTNAQVGVNTPFQYEELTIAIATGVSGDLDTFLAAYL
jgi:cytochrome c biogenesis protein ResB